MQDDEPCRSNTAGRWAFSRVSLPRPGRIAAPSGAAVRARAARVEIFEHSVPGPVEDLHELARGAAFAQAARLRAHVTRRERQAPLAGAVPSRAVPDPVVNQER